VEGEKQYLGSVYPCLPLDLSVFPLSPHVALTLILAGRTYDLGDLRICHQHFGSLLLSALSLLVL
jgi:hypothetical protein